MKTFERKNYNIENQVELLQQDGNPVYRHIVTKDGHYRIEKSQYDTSDVFTKQCIGYIECYDMCNDKYLAHSLLENDPEFRKSMREVLLKDKEDILKKINVLEEQLKNLNSCFKELEDENFLQGKEEDMEREDM